VCVGRSIERAATTYYKCLKENLMITKNYILTKSLAYIPMSSRSTLSSNYTDMIRSGINTKRQVISIGNPIDPINFKEIGTKNYWINNSVNIWNSLTVQLRLKMEICYTPIIIILY
jgi:hypothetical protein